MENNRDNKKNNVQQEASTSVAQNANPRANENIRVRTDEPQLDNERTDEVGSEITDGEDA